MRTCNLLSNHLIGFLSLCESYPGITRLSLLSCPDSHSVELSSLSAKVTYALCLHFFHSTQSRPNAVA
jgi:hypothetical protein